MANQRLYPFWSHLTIALRTGEPQNELRSGDTNPFKLLYADPERLRSFLRAMDRHQSRSEPGHRQEVSLGQLQIRGRRRDRAGDLISQVALANPHIAGIGFDLPEVGPIFEDYVVANNLSGRVAFRPGSFLGFAHPPGRRGHDGPHPARLEP